MEVCKDYNGTFRDDQSRFLCVIRKSKANGKIDINIHDKDVNVKLNKKSLVLSSEVIVDPESKQKKYILNSHTDKLSSKA